MWFIMLQVIRGETSFSGQSQLRPLDEITSEVDILARFWSMYNQYKDGASEAISEDNQNWMMFLGKHFLRKSGHLEWVEEGGSLTHTRYRREIIQPTIELLRSVLVKAHPSVRVKPDYEYANLPAQVQGIGGQRQTMRDLYDSDVAAWLTNFFHQEMEYTGEAIRQAELVCQVLVSGEAYRVFNTHHIPGYGTEIHSKLLRRDQFFGDPNGTDLNNFRDFEGIIIEEDLDAATIKRLYGVSEREYSYSAMRRSFATDESTSMSSFSRSYMFDGKGGGNWRWDQRKYKVHTLYYNFGNVEATMWGIKNDGKSAELKYPLGREIVIINFSKVASDVVNPHWHGEFPIVCYQASPLPCMARGLSEVSKIKDDQVLIDVINNVVLWSALEHSNHTIAYEEGSVIPSNIKNSPGLKLPVRPGALQNNQIERWDPPPMNRDLYAYGQDAEMHAREIVSGVTDAILGNTLPAGSSGEFLDKTARLGLNRHAFKSRMLDAGHLRAARLWLFSVQQWADFRSPRYAKMHDLGEHQFMPEAARELFWDIEVTSMADLPVDLQDRIEYGMLHVQNGWWDLEQFVQFTDPPMRPDLRQLIRDVSLNQFIPGLPSNIQAQLRLQAAQLMAQQQQIQNGGQPGPNMAQGNPPPLPPGNPNAQGQG